ncbi:uncharacterized protein PHALS_08622 [Plasmopara halstedii]|uniref:Uncharacterized protein n=1 Tax=Plasmopara halstedii TaxID=4781 RepID=A0A0P1AD99_PLAHL|nr:uncharacterized protein PHALS_08622 [Plasmopara halstedii]CEG38558.1 hypothetical protein PHALS_08622 [Plasmopara halstedii]|eukprot:XP_024574927.1 hypothetical protein PHALS_08622 [Plasmopara halstedii]
MTNLASIRRLACVVKCSSHPARKKEVVCNGLIPKELIAGMSVDFLSVAVISANTYIKILYLLIIPEDGDTDVDFHFKQLRAMLEGTHLKKCLPAKRRFFGAHKSIFA